MRKDVVTGFYYPFYEVISDEWDAKAEEYRCYLLAQTQTYEESLAVIREVEVNSDVPQVEIIENGWDHSETLAIKIAVSDNPRGYDFYDSRTDKDLA